MPAPRRRIVDVGAHAQFRASPAYSSLLAWITALADSVIGTQLPPPEQVDDDLAQPLRQALEVLARLESWLEEFPPATTSLRYGNPAYKQWHARLCAEAVPLMSTLVPDEGHAAELAAYFKEAFGNEVRIDYGTGHELTFLVWMHGLAKYTAGEDEPGVRRGLVLHVLQRYLLLMRKLQKTYWLEPAGSVSSRGLEPWPSRPPLARPRPTARSVPTFPLLPAAQHGVWGLDDYQFLPFLLGAAQLVGREGEIAPRSIHDEGLLESEHERCAPRPLPARAAAR